MNDGFMSSEQIKVQVKQLLADTDYSQLQDVQISNKTEFENYRSLLRAIYKRPSGIQEVPPPPEPQWISE